MINVCKYCKWCHYEDTRDWDERVYWCHHPEATHINIVTGVEWHGKCIKDREKDGHCGPEGIHFHHKLDADMEG